MSKILQYWRVRGSYRYDSYNCFRLIWQNNIFICFLQLFLCLCQQSPIGLYFNDFASSSQTNLAQSEPSNSSISKQRFKVLLYFVHIFPLIWFLEKVAMEDSREVVVADGGWIASSSLAPKEVIQGFVFSSLHLMNPTIVDNFKHKRKAQTYIKVHRRSFGCKPTNVKVMWCLCGWIKKCQMLSIFASNRVTAFTKVGARQTREC